MQLLMAKILFSLAHKFGIGLPLLDCPIILSLSIMSLFEQCVSTHGADLSTNLLECVSDGTEAAR